MITSIQSKIFTPLLSVLSLITMFFLLPHNAKASSIFMCSLGDIPISGNPLPCTRSISGTNAVGRISISTAGRGYLSNNTFDSIAHQSTDVSSFYLDNIVLSGPPGTSTTYSTNLSFTGTLLTDSSSIAKANVRFESHTVTLPPLLDPTNPSGYLRAPLTDLGTLYSSTYGSNTGIFTAFLTSNSYNVNLGFVSPTATAAAGDTISIYLQLYTLAYGSSALADFSHTLSFPTGSPVLNLPSGWTANSLDGCIVANTYLCSPSSSSAPEPPTILLLASGLAGLGAWWGRKMLKTI